MGAIVCSQCSVWQRRNLNFISGHGEHSCIDSKKLGLNTYFKILWVLRFQRSKLFQDAQSHNHFTVGLYVKLPSWVFAKSGVIFTASSVFLKPASLNTLEHHACTFNANWADNKWCCTFYGQSSSKVATIFIWTDYKCIKLVTNNSWLAMCGLWGIWFIFLPQIYYRWVIYGAHLRITSLSVA
jgi:hypothetical protein